MTSLPEEYLLREMHWDRIMEHSWCKALALQIIIACKALLRGFLFVLRQYTLTQHQSRSFPVISLKYADWFSERSNSFNSYAGSDWIYSYTRKCYAGEKGVRLWNSKWNVPNVKTIHKFKNCCNSYTPLFKTIGALVREIPSNFTERCCCIITSLGLPLYHKTWS